MNSKSKQTIATLSISSWSHHLSDPTETVTNLETPRQHCPFPVVVLIRYHIRNPSIWPFTGARYHSVSTKILRVFLVLKLEKNIEREWINGGSESNVYWPSYEVFFFSFTKLLYWKVKIIFSAWSFSSLVFFWRKAGQKNYL